MPSWEYETCTNVGRKTKARPIPHGRSSSGSVPTAQVPNPRGAPYSAFAGHDHHRSPKDPRDRRSTHARFCVPLRLHAVPNVLFCVTQRVGHHITPEAARHCSTSHVSSLFVIKERDMGKSRGREHRPVGSLGTCPPPIHGGCCSAVAPPPRSRRASSAPVRQALDHP